MTSPRHWTSSKGRSGLNERSFMKAVMTTGTTKLAFSSKELMRQLDKNPASPRPDAPTFEIAFETDDVAGALQRAVDAGATLIQNARDEPWGQTTSYVSDPNGYLIEICSAVQLPS